MVCPDTLSRPRRLLLCWNGGTTANLWIFQEYLLDPINLNNHCDVGPTDDYTGGGIPSTDDDIDFDDLMIFALNYDVTLSKTQVGGSEIASLAWMKTGDRDWTLVLQEPCQRP